MESPHKDIKTDMWCVCKCIMRCAVQKFENSKFFNVYFKDVSYAHKGCIQLIKNT